MFSKCGVNHAAVEQNLGCVGNTVEDFQCLVELVAVVAGEGCHPGLDFLPHYVSDRSGRSAGTTQQEPWKSLTCFRDMTKISLTSYPAVWCRQASMRCHSYSTTVEVGDVPFRSKAAR